MSAKVDLMGFLTVDLKELWKAGLKVPAMVDLMGFLTVDLKELWRVDLKAYVMVDLKVS